jgi:hypothetical protein
MVSNLSKVGNPAGVCPDLFEPVNAHVYRLPFGCFGIAKVFDAIVSMNIMMQVSLPTFGWDRNDRLRCYVEQ